jgi:osmotically-inducible protein OsmY
MRFRRLVMKKVILNNKFNMLSSIFLFSILALSGCTRVVVKEVPVNETYLGIESKNDVAQKDAIITDEVKARLLADYILKGANIYINTSNGITTLSGNVHNYDKIERAVKITKMVPGVKEVISKLTVIPS